MQKRNNELATSYRPSGPLCRDAHALRISPRRAPNSPLSCRDHGP